MQAIRTDVLETVIGAGRNDDALARRDLSYVVTDMNAGNSTEDAQDLFDGMDVCWRAVAGIAPLLKNCELLGAGCR